MGEFPSGQRGQTVNLLALPSVVRIHLRPVAYQSKLKSISALHVKALVFSPSRHILLYGMPQWRNWQTPGT